MSDLTDSTRQSERPGRDGRRQGEHEPLLAAIVAVLRRRRNLLIASITLTMLVAVLAFLQLTPRYTAQATVMIYPREEKVVDIDAVVSRLTADDQAVQSEMRVIESPDLARTVIARLGLHERAEFNPQLETSLAEALLKRLDSPWLNAAFGAIVVPPPGAAPDTPIDGAVVERFLKRLEVKALGRSRVIAIAFSSTDPRLAASVTNALADAYIAFQVDTKHAATQHAAEWLNARLQSLQAEVEASERAVEDFRADVIAAEGRDGGLVTRQINETSTQLTLARAEADKARARLARVEELIATYGPTAVFELIEPQLTMWMNEQLVRLRQTHAEVRARHGPDHPVVAELSAEIEEIRRQTADQLLAAARNDVAVAEMRVGALERALDDLLNDSVAIARAEVRLRALEREAQANAELFRTLLNRSKETAQVGLERPDALVVSRATPPGKPSFPQTVPFLALALATSLVVGCGFVFAAEELESGYRTVDQLAGELAVPVHAVVPFITTAKWRRRPADLLLAEPNGAFAESLRSLDIALASPAEPRAHSRVVQVTSAVPKDGKSSIVACLARAMARSGATVVAVDCDLRQSTLDRIFGLDRGDGVVEFLAGRAEIEDILQKDPQSDARVVAAGGAAEDPLKLLRGPRLAELLRRLRERYDVVLVDSPPVLAVADARLIAPLVDDCTLVVRWLRTRREAVQLCREQLVAAGGRVAGAVLAQVKGHAGAGYGYYGGYGYRG